MACFRFAEIARFLAWIQTRTESHRRPSVDQFVGLKLKSFRQKEGASRSELANLLSIRTADIEQIEAGHKRISAANLFILARHFDVPVAAFFGIKLDAA